MRPRIVAASTATLIAAASLSPMVAQAAGQNTLFVDRSSSACTDSGTGTLAAPYCTLQAAADAAEPGDLVSVAPGSYAATTITQSGTASAPITFTGNATWSALGPSGGASSSFDLSGASNIVIQNFSLTPDAAADAVVQGGSGIGFNRDFFRGSTAAQPAVHVTGGASAVTVQDSLVESQILVDGGSTGTVVTTNRIYPDYTSPISVVGAANTAITSNTIYGCGPGVSVTDSATDTAIENNVIENRQTNETGGACSASLPAYNVFVDPSSASSTTEDYNDVYAGGSDDENYDWAGTAYASASDLYTAAQQAQHDDNSLLGTEEVENSPLINSANSAAIGEQPVDINGDPRILDPLVTPTGAGPYDYYDRGAGQFQDPLTKLSASFTSSVAQAPVGAPITFRAAMTDTWSDTFDYQLKLSNGTTVDAGTSGTASLSFSTPGTYTAYLYVVPTNGATAPTQYVAALNIRVVPQAPLVPQLSMGADGGYGVGVDDNGTTDSWAISSVTFDFGDGTPTRTVADGTDVDHTYAKAGTYTITETVADTDGNTATTSAEFATTALVPGTLINTSGGLTTFTPADSTGIAQAAVAALPDNTGQLLAATTGGTAEFATGGTTGNNDWKAWQPLSQPGVSVKWVGIAGMPNGSSQLIEITSTGKLLHTIRNANGTWQSSGWGSPAGSTGFVHAAITAMPNGSSQLVAVTTGGVLMHNIRNANGSWQGWRALSQPGVKIIDASIAGMADGNSQIVEVTSGHVMKHDERYFTGAWQAGGWGTPPGSTGITQASISSTDIFSGHGYEGGTIISAVTTRGGTESNFRNPSGFWSGWGGATSGVGELGDATNDTVATQPDGWYLMFAVIGD